MTSNLERVPEERSGDELDRDEDPPDHLLLSATSLLPQSPPLSPGEWASEENLHSEHLIKRGSSEHLDLTSPPPKLTDMDSSLEDKDMMEEASLGQCLPIISSSPVKEQKAGSSRREREDEVDLLRETAGNKSPPSPKAYYESDIVKNT